MRPKLLPQRPKADRPKPSSSRSAFSGPFFYFFLAGLPIVIACVALQWWSGGASRGNETEKLLPLIPAPVAEQGPDRQRLANMTWGSYRAQHYFGLRMRDERSPLFGFMWFEQPEGGMPNIRHWCDQGDGLNSYAWTHADGKTFGKQTINDTAVLLQTDWLSEDPSTFRARITAVPHRKDTPRMNYYFYLAFERDTHGRVRIPQSKEIAIEGETKQLGAFKLVIESAQRKKAIVTQLLLPHVSLTKLNEHVLKHMRVSQSSGGIAYVLAQGEQKYEEGTFGVMAINGPADMQFDISFVRADVPVASDTIIPFATVLQERMLRFEREFETAFGLEAKNYSPDELKMAHVALSNMLGSIGVWHGSNKVKEGDNIVQYGPHFLLSAVPSRPFFPRGFLWDEGFHQLLISRFDSQLALECIATWLNTMNVNGWIPREMILSAEAEAKVPSEYVAQHPTVANPPSFFYLLDTITRDSQLVNRHRATFSGIYFKAAKWYAWLMSSQAGRYSDSLRWRGRNSTTTLELNPKTLASGLDDFPRASHPNDKEYHLDLRCWMAVASRVLARMAETFSTADEAEAYRRKYAELSDFDNLVKRHWTEEGKQFADFGLHSLRVRLAKKTKQAQQQQQQQHHQLPMERLVDEPPAERHVSDAMGYVGLFPLIACLIPSTEHGKLKAILDHLNDPEELWTDYGIRSLSTISPYYRARNTEHDPPYWRGSIWMPVNYLVLRALGEYAASNAIGELREQFVATHRRLKKALIGNLAKEFTRTGYLWEHYDDRTGKGLGSHPMTGWTSLVLLVMSEEDL